MVKDVIYNKMEIIERCIKRVNEVYEGNPENLKDYTKQDSIVLNIQRAIEATIDMAMHIISIKKLGIPKNSRDAFEVLQHHGIINKESLGRLKNMIGFRNIAVHNYQKLNLEILEQIIENNLKDFNEFIYSINKI
mgnify:CR=1 FL=1